MVDYRVVQEKIDKDKSDLRIRPVTTGRLKGENPPRHLFYGPWPVYLYDTTKVHQLGFSALLIRQTLTRVQIIRSHTENNSK